MCVCVCNFDWPSYSSYVTCNFIGKATASFAYASGP